MAKRALLVGCNYPGTKVELHGCVNDVKRMHASLTSRFGFDESDILVLIDTDESGMQPTGVNIRSSLAKLIRGTEAGDILVFHFSGHGTQVPPEAGEAADSTGADEAIVPTDMNLLTDDDFRQMVNEIPSGATFTFISDSCHSGGLIDSEKEQIGDSVGSDGAGLFGLMSHAFQGTSAGRDLEPSEGYEGRRGHGGYSSYDREEYGEDEESYGRRNRGGYGAEDEGYGGRGEAEEYASGYGGRGEADEYASGYGRRGEADEYASGYGGGYNRRASPVVTKEIPVDLLTQLLSDRTGHEVGVGNIRTTLFDMFGDSASPSIKTFANLVFQQLQGGGQDGIVGTVSSLATQFLQSKLEGDDEDQAASYLAPAQNAGEYRPQAQRRSAGTVTDCGILLSGCQANETSADANPSQDAADSYGAFSNAIQLVLSQTDGPISNRDLILQVRAVLQKQGFKQHPCLYSSDENADGVFICE